jgi:hypothetical protein
LQPGNPALIRIVARHCAGILSNEPIDGELYELSSVAQIDLAFYALPVRLDRFHAHVEQVRGLASAHAFADQMQDLKFTIGQAVDGVRR